MKLFNTLSNQLEEFIPINDKDVRMYVCGPTVYDRPHIGNARSVVVYDVLYRFLTLIYGKIIYVRNITDVDDKINARAIELGTTIQHLTSSTYRDFQSDMKYLNCLSPTHEPKATDHIDDMIKIIELLIQNGNAYLSNDHVYFDVTRCDDYGALAGRSLDEMIAGARVEVSENKKHPGDFVLWKPASPKDDPSSIFHSPWGKGRPGWHIECSAMSSHFLGNDLDIHGGGADLIFPHHTNEIAQSSCAFPGSKFARYWVHNGFLTVSGAKMSKSLGNFLTVQDLIDRNIKGEVIRYLLLSTHYRKPLDFNDKALYDANESMNYLYRALGSCSTQTVPDCHPEFISGSKEMLNQVQHDITPEFLEFLSDDLNTAGALSYMHELAKNINKATDADEKKLYHAQLKDCGNLLGLLETDPAKWFESDSGVSVEYIEEMIAKRATAKAEHNWKLADQIRDELKDKGIALKDNPDGTTSWGT